MGGHEFEMVDYLWTDNDITDKFELDLFFPWQNKAKFVFEMNVFGLPNNFNRVFQYFKELNVYNDYRIQVFDNNLGYFYLSYNINGRDAYNTVPYPKKEWFTIVLDKGYASIGSNSYSITRGPNYPVPQNQPYYLRLPFAINIAYGKFQMYGDNGDLLLNFCPCRYKNRVVGYKETTENTNVIGYDFDFFKIMNGFHSSDYMPPVPPRPLITNP